MDGRLRDNSDEEGSDDDELAGAGVAPSAQHMRPESAKPEVAPGPVLDISERAARWACCAKPVQIYMNVQEEYKTEQALKRLNEMRPPEATSTERPTSAPMAPNTGRRFTAAEETEREGILSGVKARLKDADGPPMHAIWRHELCECMAQRDVCLRSVRTPCVQFAINGKAIGNTPYLPGAMHCVGILGLCVCSTLYGARQRGKLRQKLGIHGSFKGDVRAHLPCCCCCALAQEANEIGEALFVPVPESIKGKRFVEKQIGTAEEREAIQRLEPGGKYR